MQVISLILVGAFSLGGVLLQVGTFISASSSAAAVFDVIEEVTVICGCHRYFIQLYTVIIVYLLSCNHFLHKGYFHMFTCVL